jgi:hypothetical protein
MTNTISKDVFKAGMKRLETAFMKDVSKATITLYYEKLRGFNDRSFKKIVENIIDNDHFFPSIARFKQSPEMEAAMLQEEINKQPSLEEMIS